ncbi:MAG: amidohydrolase [Lachnospiraceae bacterium]|nr:amidohydrolase [Lachnospiraceae bacterium]
MIIDAHCHIGTDVTFDQQTTEEELWANFEKYGVDGGIVQPYLPRPYPEEFKKIHDRIYQMSKAHPGRIFGMSSVNPHFYPEDYDRETIRCVKELGFVGIKITPPGHAISPCSKDGFHVFELARELKVPVMVHTGMGVPFADPIQVEPCAENFPDVTIVIAHAGANFYTHQAISVARRHENVFIEPSGAGIESTYDILKTLGPSRVMFSSDVILQMAPEKEKYLDLYRRGVLTEEGLEQVMYKTVQTVFQLKL